MDRYVNFDDLWAILKAVEYEGKDADEALVEIINLLKRVHGAFKVKDNKFEFIERYNLLDYKYSGCIIGSDDEQLRIESNKKLLDKIDEEKRVVDWLISRLNEEFKLFRDEEVYLKVFHERYFKELTVRNLLNKYKINNKKYYRIIIVVEHLAQEAWLLFRYPPEFYEFYYSLDEH